MMRAFHFKNNIIIDNRKWGMKMCQLTQHSQSNMIAMQSLHEDKIVGTSSKWRALQPDQKFTTNSSTFFNTSKNNSAASSASPTLDYEIAAAMELDRTDYKSLGVNSPRSRHALMTSVALKNKQQILPDAEEDLQLLQQLHSARQVALDDEVSRLDASDEEKKRYKKLAVDEGNEAIKCIVAWYCQSCQANLKEGELEIALELHKQAKKKFAELQVLSCDSMARLDRNRQQLAGYFKMKGDELRVAEKFDEAMSCYQNARASLEEMSKKQKEDVTLLHACYSLIHFCRVERDKLLEMYRLIDGGTVDDESRKIFTR